MEFKGKNKLFLKINFFKQLYQDLIHSKGA